MQKGTTSCENEFRDIGLDGTYGKFCQGRVFVLKMFSRENDRPRRWSAQKPTAAINRDVNTVPYVRPFLAL